MDRKIFCIKCKKYVTYTVKQEKETYPVKGEDITIMAKLSYCSFCNTLIWNNELDDDNLKSAFEIYNKKHPDNPIKIKY